MQSVVKGTEQCDRVTSCKAKSNVCAVLQVKYVQNRPKLTQYLEVNSRVRCFLFLALSSSSTGGVSQPTHANFGLRTRL